MSHSKLFHFYSLTISQQTNVNMIYIFLIKYVMEVWWLRLQGRFNPGKTRKFFLFSVCCFGAYEIRLQVFAIFLQIHVIIKSWRGRKRYPLSLRCVQVPVTIQETGDWGIKKLWLLSLQTPMVHVSIREHPKNEDLFESLI